METVDHPELPLCPRLKVEWNRFWFSIVWQDLTHGRVCALDWYMRVRGANFMQLWVGPVTVILRKPWLAGPARQLYPQLFGGGK